MTWMRRGLAAVLLCALGAGVALIANWWTAAPGHRISREVEAEPGCHGSHAFSEDAQVLPPILVAGRQRLGGRPGPSMC